MRGSMPAAPGIGDVRMDARGYSPAVEAATPTSLANVLADVETRIGECHVLANNIRLALYGPEPDGCGNGCPESSGVVWSAARLKESATDLAKALDAILAAIEKR